MRIDSSGGVIILCTECTRNDFRESPVSASYIWYGASLCEYHFLLKAFVNPYRNEELKKKLEELKPDVPSARPVV